MTQDYFLHDVHPISISFTGAQGKVQDRAGEGGGGVHGRLVGAELGPVKDWGRLFTPTLLLSPYPTLFCTEGHLVLFEGPWTAIYV